MDIPWLADEHVIRLHDNFFPVYYEMAGVQRDKDLFGLLVIMQGDTLTWSEAYLLQERM